MHKIEPNTSTPSINFKNFANSYKDVDPSSLNQGWVAYAQSIGNTDKELLKFLSDVDNNKRQISDIDTYIQSATQSTSQFATSLKNIAVNAGSILLINLVIQAGMLAWDNLNVTVEEQESKVNSLQAAYQNLQSEYEQLSSKQDLTDAEQKRLSYLERRLELDERILKAEEHQLFEEKTGTKFTDWFDKDNYNVQYAGETTLDRINTNPNNYAFLSKLYDQKMDDIKATQEQIAEWTKYRDTVAESSDAWNVYQSHIDDAQNRQTAAMKDLEDGADKMTINLGKYADNIQYFEECLASGDLNDEDTAIAEEHFKNWQELYHSTEKMLSDIQKLNGTYDDTNDRVAKSIRSIYDDHGSADRDAYSDDEFGYEKLVEYTNKLTPEQKELWITATDGIHNAEEAIKAFEAELSALESMETADSADAGLSTLFENLSTKLKPALTSLKSAYEEVFADGFHPKNIDSDMLDGIHDSIVAFNKTADIGFHIDMDAFNNFAQVMTNANVTSGQAQEAFNILAGEIYNASTATDELTEETAGLFSGLLESMGIANADELAMRALAESKGAALIASHNLAEASQADMFNLLNEGQAAGITREMIYQLAAAEIAYNTTGLSTEEKINQLKGLADAYGDTAVSALAASAANRVINGRGDYKTVLSDMMAAIKRKTGNFQIEFNPVKPGKASSSGAAKSAKSETNALSGLNSEMDKLQSSYKSLCDIRDTYNQNGKITVDQYQELTNMGFTFLSQLVDENGQLGLNASAFERLSQAKLEEMQIQMARNAADTINGLKTEAAAVEYLTYANEQLRNAALGAAEAELEAAVVNARRRGGSQAEAASQIYQGYQAAKQMD